MCVWTVACREQSRAGEANLVGVSLNQGRKLSWGDSVRYEIKLFSVVYLGGRSKGNWWLTACGGEGTRSVRECKVSEMSSKGVKMGIRFGAESTELNLRCVKM